VLGLSGPRWMGFQNKAFPARSSRPSQGEGEVGFFTLSQGESLRRNDEAGGQRVRVGTEWSTLDGAPKQGPPRSYLATLPRGG
jgi:hypothetical protein